MNKSVHVRLDGSVAMLFCMPEKEPAASGLCEGDPVASFWTKGINGGGFACIMLCITERVIVNLTRNPKSTHAVRRSVLNFPNPKVI